MKQLVLYNQSNATTIKLLLLLLQSYFTVLFCCLRANRLRPRLLSTAGQVVHRTPVYSVSFKNMPPNRITINTSPLHPCVYRPRSNDTRTTGGTMIITKTKKKVMAYFKITITILNVINTTFVCLFVCVYVQEEYVLWSRPDRSIAQFWCRD